jgi:hypothetical protein
MRATAYPSQGPEYGRRFRSTRARAKVGAEKTARIAPLGVAAKGKLVVRSARMTKASKPKGFGNLKGPEDRLGSRRFRHLKVIGYTPVPQPLFAKASIADDLEGVIELDARASVGQYVEAAKKQRAWAREARLSESAA